MNQDQARNALRITKYNPIHRDERGHYTRDEWTACSDIGKTFEGKTLEPAEYLAVEDAHVAFIQRFLQLHHVETLRVHQLENYAADTMDDDCLGSAQLYAHFHGIHDGSRLQGEDIPRIVRAILRELFWCSLTSEDETIQVHFGYDYYMYIIPSTHQSELAAIATSLGLFLA